MSSSGISWLLKQCHQPRSGTKKQIPLRIPPPDMVQDWPDSLFPTRGDFGRHIKSELRHKFAASLHPRDLQRYQSVVRHKLQTLKRSHLQTESGDARGALWQCSTSLFSLTFFYELSNEAFVHSTALLLGTPLPHALYLKAHDEKYANIDEWGDFLTEWFGTRRRQPKNYTQQVCNRIVQNRKWMCNGYYLQRITITVSRSGATRSKQETSRYDDFFRRVRPRKPTFKFH